MLRLNRHSTVNKPQLAFFFRIFPTFTGNYYDIYTSDFFFSLTLSSSKT